MAIPLRLGTRGSALARAQARLVEAALLEAHGAERPAMAIATEIITTTGDQVKDRPLAEIGGKGLFTKEIDEALLAGRVDFAVHSLKDMETRLAAGLIIAAVLPRADPRDALIGARSLGALSMGARVGTSALRRRAQLLALRSDLEILPLRGNVDTRLEKLRSGGLDAILLAKAGLDRLGRADAIDYVFPSEEMLPAVGQGVIAVAARTEDAATQALLARVNHAATFSAIRGERALLAGLDGNCRTPVAAHGRLAPDGMLSLSAALFTPDGRHMIRKEIMGAAGEAEKLGAELAVMILKDAGAELRAVIGKGL